MNNFIITLVNGEIEDIATQKLTKEGFSVDQYYREGCLLIRNVQFDTHMLQAICRRVSVHWTSIEAYEPKTVITIEGRPIHNELVIYREQLVTLVTDKAQLGNNIGLMQDGKRVGIKCPEQIEKSFLCGDMVFARQKGEQLKQQKQQLIFDLMFYGCQSINAIQAQEIYEALKAGKLSGATLEKI